MIVERGAKVRVAAAAVRVIIKILIKQSMQEEHLKETELR